MKESQSISSEKSGIIAVRVDENVHIEVEVCESTSDNGVPAITVCLVSKCGDVLCDICTVEASQPDLDLAMAKCKNDRDVTKQFLTGEEVVTETGKFPVVQLSERQMTTLGFLPMYDSEDKKYRIMGNRLYPCILAVEVGREDFVPSVKVTVYGDSSCPDYTECLTISVPKDDDGEDSNTESVIQCQSALASHADGNDASQQTSVKWNEVFQETRIFNQPALFTNRRLVDREIPDGLYRYDLGGSDDDPGEPVYVEQTVIVNHAASIITDYPLDLGPDGIRWFTEDDGLDFSIGGDKTLQEFFDERLSEDLMLTEPWEDD